MVMLKLDDDLLSAFIFYGCLLGMKTAIMSFLTARHRLKNKAMPSPEDYGAKNKDKPVPVNPDVERVRRAHQNDLENIPIFLIIALVYMYANLSPARGIWCLRIFTAARILHTVAYLNELSRPRGMGFGIGALCTFVLGFSVLYSAIRVGKF